MSISYNTGATADSGGSQTTSQAITVPAGVLAGDVVLILAQQVPLTSTPSTFTASSTGTTPTSAGSPVTGTEATPAAVTGQVFWFAASATDAGKVVTITASATGFWAMALVAYTGASNSAPIDVISGAFGGAGSLSVTCPTVQTVTAGDWAVFLGGGAGENATALTPPAGSTTRQSDVSSSQIDAVISDSNGSAGGAGTSIGGGTFTSPSGSNAILTAFTLGLAPPHSSPSPAVLTPPGYLSPAAWKQFPYRRLGQTITIAGSGGVVLPKPSLAGSGSVSTGTVLPAVQPMPPGLSSPAAWQYPRYPRLGQTVTIAGSGGVVLPKPSLSGSGVVGLQVAQRPLMPPGFLSPAAWQQPAYPRLGQTVTIAGSGGVVLPKPSLAGAGAVSPPLARPPLMPPGFLSPAAWQAPPYPRLGQVVTIAGSGGVVLPKPSLAGSGNVTVSGVARPPVMPPGLASPAAWQFPPYRRLPMTATAITGSGGVVFPKPSLAGAAPQAVAATAVKQGGWWQLLDINRYREQEFAFYATNPPMSCPRCGEPLTNAPPTDAGSSVELFCRFDGWQFPRDWMRP